MKKKLFVLLILILFSITGLLLTSSRITFPVIAPAGFAAVPKFYDYSGITHVHSKLSTGSGTFEEIERAALKAHCQFLIFTDLNPPAQPADVEGYKQGLLVIWAAEMSYLGAHVLAYNFNDNAMLNRPGQAQVFLNDLLHKTKQDPKDGFLIAAHPFLPQHSFPEYNDPGLSGLEVINMDSLWNAEITRSKLSVLWSFALLSINPDLAFARMFRYPNKEIAAWDQIASKRPFYGFVGNDSTANAIPFPQTSYKFPSYYQSFTLMRDHVLLKSELTGLFGEDRKKIMMALAHGNFYMSLDLIGDPVGFAFTATRNRGRRTEESIMGQTVENASAAGPVTFHVDLGRDLGTQQLVEILLFRNGEVVAQSKQRTLDFAAHKQKGSYRAEVRVLLHLPFPDAQRWMPWIFSNPIRID